MLADRFRSSLSSNEEEVLVEYRMLKNAVAADTSLKTQSTHRVMEEVVGPLAETLPNLAKLAAVGLLIPASTAGKLCNRVQIDIYFSYKYNYTS